jgi:cytochrome c-type biogenesis protein CcmF
MTTGNFILYASFVAGMAAVILLFQKSNTHDVKIKWLIRIFSCLLTADFLLLTYYFYTTDLTINYVWTYTSYDLPLVYKLSGTLAGQQGTLLFWAFLIGIGSLWLNEKEDIGLNFIKKSQILILSLGIYFIGLTLLDSPFKTIYQVEPTLPSSFVPTDGNGLNPLLIDPWMAVHPPLIFLGYAAMTVPFAVAIVYLYSSIKRESGIHRLWLRNAVQWCRASWLFLTLGIAVGGFWSY